MEYDYESDPVITQMLIYAFLCGSITIIIIRKFIYFECGGEGVGL